ncbi:MAG: hypothetical protein ACFFCS_17800 [Candidatus Hodarchaeota archaeon]
MYFNSIFYIITGAMYIGYPLSAGLMVDLLYFFTYLFFTVGGVSLLCAIFYRKRVVGGCCVPLYIMDALLFTFLYLFLNSIYNIFMVILSVIMVVLNIIALIFSQLLKNSKISKKIIDEPKFYRGIDMNRKYPRLKTSILIFSFVAIAVLGVGSYKSWGRIITVKAPDDFKTISSFWGAPSRTLEEVDHPIATADVNSLIISNSSLNMSVPNLINGSIAYVVSVTHGANMTNFCDYSNGAESYPNGTVILSQPLPNTTGVNVVFKYIYNIEVFQYLQLGNSTCIMNFGSYYNNIYEEPNFFEYIQSAYIFQVMDFWEVKYYINVVNPWDYPHVFNTIDTMPMCYSVLDWFYNQSSQGFGTYFTGISPDFESGEYEYHFLGNSTAPEPIPGPLIPDIIDEDNWYNYNSQDPDVYAEAIQLWEDVYAHASSLGYKSYAVFQGNAMRDTVDGDIDTTRLPTYPISPNPDVRYGIMSYVDSKDDIEGGRYHQYKDCKDQIAIYGDQGRSILTGWIWPDRQYYPANEMGLGRYIEDILICQAAGMEEIFHAPISGMQELWGDDAILIVHQALNEWNKTEHKIYVPSWSYSDDYMDAVKNFNKLWLFIPIIILIGLKLSLGGFFKPRRFSRK